MGCVFRGAQGLRVDFCWGVFRFIDLVVVGLRFNRNLAGPGAAREFCSINSGTN